MNELKFLVAMALVITSTIAEAQKDVKYVGDGRYVCQGSDCKDFDRRQEERNQDREDRERYHREDRQDSRAIVDELKREHRGEGK